MLLEDFFQLGKAQLCIGLILTIIVQLDCKEVLVDFMQLVLLCVDVHDSFHFRFLLCGADLRCCCWRSVGGSAGRLLSLLLAVLVQMNYKFIYIRKSVFDWADGKERDEGLQGGGVLLGGAGVYIIDKIIGMDCVRHAEKSGSHQDMQPTLKKEALVAVSGIPCEVEQEGKKLKAGRLWSFPQRDTYAKVLLSYLMNNLDVNRIFIEHLSTLLKKTCREVSLFHRKMLAQHRSLPSILTHLLRRRLKNPSHQLSLNIASVCPPELIALSEDFGQQELQLGQKEQNYLRNLVFAQESLEQYEEDLSDDGQVEDLDDIGFEKQEKTNDSFDSDEENEQGGQAQGNSSFDQLSR